MVNIRRSPGRFEVPPLLPAMDEPAVYILHPDVMQVNTRKNYVRDRMRATLIYISEYEETKHMMMEGRYNNDDTIIIRTVGEVKSSFRPSRPGETPY